MSVTLYPGIPFSPQATLTNNIGAADTIIEVSDISAFPPAPNLATIGTDGGGETVLYTAKTKTALSGCQRGIEGTAKAWTAGELIGRNFTAKDHADMIAAVSETREEAGAAASAADAAVKAAENAVTIEGGGTMVPPAGLGPGPYTMILDDDDGGGDDPGGDGGESPPVPAADVTYDGAASGLEAETVQAAIDELSARDDSNPIGTVISFLGLTAPEGYLVCDGAAYSIADYPALSAFIAAQFGSANHFGGDGTTTFAVPDMRNLFLRGYHGTAEEQLSGDVGARQEGTEHPGVFTGSEENQTYIVGGIKENRFSHIDTSETCDRKEDDTGFIAYYGTPNPTIADYPYLYTSRPINMAILYCIKAKTRI